MKFKLACVWSLSPAFAYDRIFLPVEMYKGAQKWFLFLIPSICSNKLLITVDGNEPLSLDIFFLSSFSDHKIIRGRRTGGLYNRTKWAKKWLKQKPEASWPLSAEVDQSLSISWLRTPALQHFALTVITQQNWIFNISLSLSYRSWMPSQIWWEKTPGIY